MKNLFVFAIVAMALTIFNGCQKEEQVLIDEQPQAVVKPDVYVENGYLTFISQEVFDSTIMVLQNMSDTEFYSWEKSLGFVSANTYLLNAEKDYKFADTEERKLNFRTKHSEHLKISDNFDMIDLKFYAKGMGDILNISGVLKIDEVLYLFTENKEYVILNGDKNLLNSIKKGVPTIKLANKDVVVFDPFKRSELKSATEFLLGGEIYTDNYDKRLNYTFERSIFISSTYIQNNQVTYNITYSLFFRMKQYDKNWLGYWVSDATSYWVCDQEIDWNVGVLGDDTYIWNGLYWVLNPNPDGKIPYNDYQGTWSDKYFGTTSNSVYVYYTSSVFASTNPSYYFDVNDYSCTFRSNRMHDYGCSSCMFWEYASYQD